MSFPLISCPYDLNPWQACMMPPGDYLEQLDNGGPPNNTILLGPGTNFLINEISKGFDLPSIQTKDEQWARRNRSFIGLDVVGERLIDLELWVAPLGTGDQWSALANFLADAFTVGGDIESPFWINLPGYGTLSSMVRTHRRTMAIDINVSATGLLRPRVELHASDPAWYEPVYVSTLFPGSHEGGLEYPVTYPLTYTSSTSGIVLGNAGNWPFYPLVKLYGPLTQPSVLIGGVGVTLANGNTPTIASDQMVTIDFGARVVTVQVIGTSVTQPVMQWVQPGAQWPSIPPGNTSQSLTLTTAGGTGQAVILAPQGAWML